MGDISPNFSRHEFSCGCGCGFSACDIELLDVLEDLRIYFGGNALVINSGCRCPYWNGHEGGRRNSRHLDGIAADFTIRYAQTGEIHNYLDIRYPRKYGIGLYPTWVHLDVRRNKGRW